MVGHSDFRKKKKADELFTKKMLLIKLLLFNILFMGKK